MINIDHPTVKLVKRHWFLLLWVLALVGYFSPWISRQPFSAATNWNAYDLYDAVLLLPEIETGAISVNLQSLRAPLLGLAVLLCLHLAGSRQLFRIGGVLLSLALAFITLPPYPIILTAWRTPGWRVPFWWAVVTGAFCIAAVWMLPKFNYRSQELRRRIYEGANAVFRRWLRPPFAIDGWRVDVANMLGRQGAIQIGTDVTRGIRKAVKETRSDAYLMGENFFDGTPQLQGDQWDGIMNYAGFSSPLAYWLTGFEVGAHGLKEKIESPISWPTTALAATWQQYLSVVPWQITLQQFNLLDSHDVPRIRSLLHENDALQRLAAIVQFTFPGVPCVYYGDEIGMVDDPILRQRGCMILDETRWDADLLAFYKKLIKLRRETAVLHTGSFQILAVEEDTIVYQREGENGRVLVIAHRSETPRLPSPLPIAHGGMANGTQFIEYFTGQRLLVQNGNLLLDTHPQGASLYKSYKFEDKNENTDKHR